MQELENLSKTAGVEVVAKVVQTFEKQNPTFYIGKGKLEEIRKICRHKQVRTLIFNDNLSQSQVKNIASFTHCKVIDRTQLILDIFANHAHTNRAKLQVELAQLEYSYSRLKHLWGHLSRIEGGIGTRGPGEKQIEIDRRLIQKRIQHLKDKLEEIRQITYTKRNHRSRFKVISLVGYTNAGKSTIFNRLTQANVLTADQLFATLDPASRYIPVPKGNHSILTDTIGFIKDLPHCLIESFHSTLVEVVNADLLLHVVDLSDPDYLKNMQAVDSVLKEIGADDIDTCLVFNKIDLFGGMGYKLLKKQLKERYPVSIFLSAVQDPNMTALLDIICERLEQRKSETQLEIPMKMEKLIAFLEKKTEIISMDCDPDKEAYIVEVRGERELLERVKEQLEKFNQLEYINS
jgi:GTP-binding protein HflX